VVPERLLGKTSVFAKLGLGVERLELYFTNERILVAHLGKRGAGAVSTTSLLGSFSSAIEDILKSGKEKRKKKPASSAQEILKRDPDNFSIRYDEAVQVTIEGDPSMTRLTIVTKSDKFEFQHVGHLPQELVEQVKNLLGEKATIRVGPVGT